MTARFDVVVIGGGVLGCFAARNLRRWNLHTALVEAEADVCTGITRANSAIVYAGYDNQTGSRKAQMTVRGNAGFDRLCRELQVPFSRCGSLLVRCGNGAGRDLRRKLLRGQENGVPGLRLLTGEEARELEPMLTEDVTEALYAPTTGTVNPWKLGIAAFENAVENGCVPMLGTAVTAIEFDDSGYLVRTTGGTLRCRAVINCAGLAADRVQELLFPPSIRIFADAADFLVLDKLARKPSRVIFHQAEACGKGITAIPCPEGNLLLSGIRRPAGVPYATTPVGISLLHRAAADLLPQLDLGMVIRSFGAMRPNPQRVVEQNGQYVPDGSHLGDFCIEHPAVGFYSLIAVKTPGLTCAQELGMHLAECCAEELGAAQNPNFNPCRAPRPAPAGDIICRCEQITRGEILGAIARGAVTVDGVKRRVGSGMGRCQGSRCSDEIQQILEALGHGTY